jgi:predicted transcriptional regulator
MKLKAQKREKGLMLSLSEAEMAALERLADRKGQTKSAILRQALRLYESLDTKLSEGNRLVLEAPDETDKTEVLLL